MTTEPEPKQKAGIEASVRSATTEDAAAIAAVHVASWRSTYRELLPDEFLARLSTDRREAMWREQIEAIQEDRSKFCLLVAQQSPAELIGFASAGPEREQDCGFQGELYAIYLLEEHQGKGLGRPLAVRHQKIRVSLNKLRTSCESTERMSPGTWPGLLLNVSGALSLGGAEGIRTLDLLNGIQ